MAKHNVLGEQGEKFAQEYLEDLGYEIVCANWKERKFEIDLIAKDGSELVFVEVKTRSTAFFGNPEEAVTLIKQKHLINGADYYIQKNEIDFECRFDIIAIVLNTKQKDIKQIKNAFSPSF